MASWLEIGANAVTTASIFLAARNSIHTWWTGIGGCVLFALLFYETRLYADVALQAFFIGTSLFGWWQWLRGDQGRPLKVTRADTSTLALAVVGGVTAAGAYGWLLHRFTDAYAPFVDSTVLVFSLIAQLLLMRRRLETWLFWLAVDTIAVPLFASRELYVTAALYSAYWVNALVAWFSWRRMESGVAPSLPAAS